MDAVMEEQNAENTPENLEEVDVDRRHPCSKLFVRTVTVLTCLHMIIHRRVTPVEDDLIRCQTFSFIHTCAPNQELANYEDPDATDVGYCTFKLPYLYLLSMSHASSNMQISYFVVRWVMFGSFPMMSLIAMIVSGPVMAHWPRLVERLVFYMFLESLFRSFAFMYSISSADGGGVAPWSDYMLASLYSILLWFFFLNFLVNMQLTEFDCRTAREIAGGIVAERNIPPAENN
ncbi:hypothetical protein ANCDUO_23183 [Ancylostoma duodenale]|uniref:Uncharacterized protein n=1 Tax=Ancylostoma duodenale TaxID=51022 RepID=A0A0C2FPH6_9BILA|nr:hypothetical protein ANCDUO_23183 [Ancylostoma duodenale]